MPHNYCHTLELVFPHRSHKQSFCPGANLARSAHSTTVNKDADLGTCPQLSAENSAT